jgi:hypothetical protein
MDLFNVCYEILPLAFQRFFAHTEESDAQLAALADATVALMVWVVRPLGDLITTLPAGPSFELFYESDYLLPHRAALAGYLEWGSRLARAESSRAAAGAQAEAAGGVAGTGPRSGRPARPARKRPSRTSRPSRCPGRTRR